jgi:hypothetical protein
VAAFQPDTLKLFRAAPLTFLVAARMDLSPVRFRCKVAHKHFFKKILKVLQRAPLKNTSELKQRRKQQTEP